MLSQGHSDRLRRISKGNAKRTLLTTPETLLAGTTAATQTEYCLLYLRAAFLETTERNHRVRQDKKTENLCRNQVISSQISMQASLLSHAHVPKCCANLRALTEVQACTKLAMEDTNVRIKMKSAIQNVQNC